MIKKKQEEESDSPKPKNKPDPLARLTGLVESMVTGQKELTERIEDLEKSNAASSADAILRMINLMYDTDDKHLPELTRIPINAVRPHAYGMMLEALFDEDVQSGKVPLSRVLRLAQFRLMRSVGGVHLGRGVRLAEEQASAESEKTDELELGGGGD